VLLDLVIFQAHQSSSECSQYKKQQRELQCRFKRNGYEDVLILTIDQCQKQESDIVIISLVQKPTRFLNKNRLNAALSRVREKLYLIADKMQFREASCNLKWDCSLLAKDLLEMAGADDALESESDQVYRS
jgi:superfamily I DNA and/or RNA helicase